MGSYEDFCRDYALHGNPERDHWDHEEAARFDRFDGHRSLCTAGYDFSDPGCGDDQGEPATPPPAPAPAPQPPFDDDVPF